MPEPPRPTPDELLALDPEGSFLERLRNDRQAVADLGGGHDLEPLKRIAHQLAGAAATFGYPELGEVAIDLDDGFREGRRVTAIDVARLLAALEQALALPVRSA